MSYMMPSGMYNGMSSWMNGQQGGMGSTAPPGTDPGTTPGDFKFGMNAPTINMGIQGLNTLGNLWGAWQSNKLAKDQLNFTKMITNTNLNNQMQAYNTALEDRSRSRAAVEGQSAEQAAAYVSANRLNRQKP